MRRSKYAAYKNSNLYFVLKVRCTVIEMIGKKRKIRISSRPEHNEKQNKNRNVLIHSAINKHKTQESKYEERKF